MRKAYTLSLCLLAAALALTPALSATTTLKMNTRDMALDASMIVSGTCVALESHWVDNTLVTLATVRVEESLKGATAQQITVALPGGFDAQREFPVGVTYAGAPTLRLDESALLFLSPFGQLPDTWMVAGFAQGKYSIVEDGAGNRFATRNLAGVTLRDRRGGDSVGGADAVSLDALKAEIQRALDEAATAPLR